MAVDPLLIIQHLSAQIETAALVLHLAALPAPRYRPCNSAEIIDALNYVRDTLRGYGWLVVDQPCYDEHLGNGINIVATLPGVTRPDSLVVVGAHYDTVEGSPGGDDNGSGLAGLLELARLLAGRRWEASIQLVAFDFEERAFAGSRTYVEALPREQVEFRGAIILEAIGYSARTTGSQQIPAGIEQLYPDVIAEIEEQGLRGDFLAVLGSHLSQNLLQVFAEWATVVAPDLPLVSLPVPLDAPVRHLFRSDHLPFWEAGLPALLLTDTADFRNPHYHLPSDQPGTLDPFFWRRVMAATLAAVIVLAGPV